MSHKSRKGVQGLSRLLVTAIVALTACGDGSPTTTRAHVEDTGGDSRAGEDGSQSDDGPTTTTDPAGPSAAPPPPPPPPSVGPVPPQGLVPKDRGPQVNLVEQRLAALHYDVGVVDDVYDAATQSGVTAFQKIQGLPRTGRVTQDVADALTNALPPGPLVPGGGATRIEIDLPKQVLLLWQNDSLTRVLPISTASGTRFCHRGRCRVAVTPVGSYRIGYRVDGWRRSPLGRLFRPSTS